MIGLIRQCCDQISDGKTSKLRRNKITLYGIYFLEELRDEIQSFGKIHYLASVQDSLTTLPLFLSCKELYQLCNIHMSYLLQGGGLVLTLLCSK